MKEDVMRDIDVVVRGMETIAEDTARELAETPKWRIFRRRKLKKRIEEATRNTFNSSKVLLELYSRVRV